MPRDEPSADRKSAGYSGFLRYACKMATGAGKTTVMGMLTAWSILNKVASRGDKRFSDVVVVVCPNVTIRDRLTELQTGAWGSEHLPHPRPGADASDAPARAGAGAGHKLARLRTAERADRRGKGRKARRSCAEHAKRFESGRRRRRLATRDT